MKSWRFAALLLTAIALGAALAHLQELPGNLTYDAHQYAFLHRAFYPTFGWTVGCAEGLALLAVVGLVWRVRDRGVAFPLTIGAAACQLLALVFLALVLSAHRAMAGWSLDAIPPNWTIWRNQWEYGHAIRAVLLLIAFVALLVSVVRELPAELPLGRVPPSSAGVLETPRHGTSAAVICDTPRDGLRVVYIGTPEERNDKKEP